MHQVTFIYSTHYDTISTIYRTNMPHVSKQKMDQQMLERFFFDLERLVADTKAKDSRLIITTLLTKTERIMLTKRLAGALLFAQGHSQYKVWNTLKISPSTAQKMFLQYENGVYAPLIKIAKRTPNNEKLWSSLDLILRAGMPSRAIKDRWKFLDSV